MRYSVSWQFLTWNSLHFSEQELTDDHATKPFSDSLCSPEPLLQLNVGSNSLMPFYTMIKPTCGYRFSRETAHNRQHTGIHASNPVMWRSCMAKNKHSVS
uniref:Uncharacterized protein n=1 Tax=Esox lucius TaxID=8010 RepID=A0A3P9A5A9_ESOLU